MEFTPTASGLMFAAAAGLWLIYLMPTWFRRREYLATERNAVRLQQTLRVLAETAEVPGAVRVETSARSIAAQEKALRQEKHRMDAMIRSRNAQAARLASQRLTGNSAPMAAKPASAAVVARRLRKTRAVTSIVGFVAVVVALVQLALIIFTGAVPASVAILGFATIAAITSVGTLGRLARVSRKRVVAPVQVARPARTVAAPRVVQEQAPVQEAAPIVEWTPVPVPKPLYLGRPVAPKVVIDADPLEALRVAAVEADRALRAAHAEPEVIPIVSAPSRFARMGIVEPTEVGSTDLDAVLRRRRA
ncbi:hypothetical protein [Glaciihabitans sp. dw_435]|uniref:hypothetical protein n=1 Tax=Glaciihabitans sp. dw_435 TaxID=2720081 RepID=UPI001BD68BAB|nr:hypothetical protein [Glaciihabitans sp. dw_435]